MFLGKDLIGNPIISVDSGRQIGKVQDMYLSPDRDQVIALYVGSEGLFNRKAFLIKQEDVVVMGADATLVRTEDVVHEETAVPERESWLRRDELHGRSVDTTGGTKLGRVGDIILDKTGKVHGVSLSQVFVSGPLYDNCAVAFYAIHDVGDDDNTMTIDIEKAERQSLTVTEV